jgi:hypothetical protein
VKCFCGNGSGEGGGWNCEVKPGIQQLVKCFCGNRSGEGGGGREGWIAQLSLETTAGDMFMWQWEWRGRGDRVREGWNGAVKP